MATDGNKKYIYILNIEKKWIQPKRELDQKVNIK